jgi:DNA-binding MarR family transcriptional regulator
MSERLSNIGRKVYQASERSHGQPVFPTDDSVGYVVRDVHRAFSRALQAKIAAHGVSMGQWFFLRALWDEDGLTQRELSQRVGMMEPTTVTALNSMERRGLVERVRNPHDRRKVNIYLTPKGRSLREVLLPCAAEVSELATRGVQPADLALAIDLLHRMIINLGDSADSI